MDAYGRCGGGFGYPTAPLRSSRLGSACGSIALFVLLVVVVWWLFSGKSQEPEVFRCVDDLRTPRRSSEGEVDLLLYGEAARAAQAHTPVAHPGSGCAEPSATATPRMHPSSAGAAVQEGATVPQSVQAPHLASHGGLDVRGGSFGTELNGAFEMSDVTKEYMEAYNPTGLASVMPAGWKSEKPQHEAAGAGAFAEFSRYSISPEAVAKSENMRAVLRLSENTRQQMSRTLGSESLLRNAVTPIGPYPVGDKAMLWNDSSVRQAYIAAATGSFPSLDYC